MPDELGTASIGIEIDTSKIKSGFDDAKAAAERGATDAGDAANDALGESLGATEKTAGDAGDAAGSSFSDKLMVGVGGAVALVGVALAGIGVAAFDMAGQSNAAFNELKAQLGATDEEAAALRDTALEIFGGNWGDSVEDVNQSLITTRQQMRGLADEELQAVTEKALAVRDVFGIDVAESTNAANTLMTEFGLTSTEAFDFIVAGNQRGLNASGDFLETVGEYSVQFGDAGFSADDFFSTLETGMQGGVLGTDKIADSFKEFRILMMSQSEDVTAALYDMGIDANVVLEGLESGTLSVNDAFGMVQEGLKSTDNQIYQNTYGIALFGTQWEDAGKDAILSVDMTKTGMADLAGSTDSLNAKYNSLGAMFTGVWRTVQVEILLPIGNKLLELANVIMPYVSGAIAAIGAALSGEGGGLAGLVANLGAVFANLIPTIVTALSSILTSMMGWVSANAPAWLTALGQFAHGLIQWIADALPLVAANLAAVSQALIGWVMTNAPGWATALVELGLKLVGWILDALPGLITNLGSVLTGMLAWVVDSIPGWVGQLAEMGAQMWQWVVDALPGLGTQLGTVLGALLSWAADALTTIVPKLAELGFAFISWIVTDVLPELPGALANILLALGTFLGNVLREVVPKLAEIGGKFISWIADDVLPALPGKLGEIWSAISTWIGDTAGKALIAAKLIGSGIAEGISGAISSGMAGLRSFVAGIINPIITGVNTLIEGLNLVNPMDDIPFIDYMARGGITTGRLTVLGEQGLERVQGQGIDVLAGMGLYDLPAGLRVTPAAETAAMMQNGGRAGSSAISNNYYTMNITSNADTEDVAAQFDWMRQARS